MTAVALVRQRGKEEPRPLAQLLREQVNLRRAFLAAQQYIGVARKVLEAHIRKRAPEVIRRHLFEFVRLVEDDGCGLRQNARVRRGRRHFTHRGVGKEEVMIHDDQIRLHGAASHLGDEAVAIVGTCAAQASL